MLTLPLPAKAVIFLVFLMLVSFSFLAGRLTVFVLKYILSRFCPESLKEIYQKFITSSEEIVKSITINIYIIFSLRVLEDYQAISEFLEFILYLALTIEIAWFLSCNIREWIKHYIVEFTQKVGQETNDVILMLEFLVNLVIGFFAVVFFAESQGINLSFILAQLGIGGVAVAFASKKILEQLVGTIAIYLDRPYRIGDYLRVNFNPKAEDLYARVESIGIRSTKLRVVATNTLVIAPNSLMAAKNIENISKGAKAMILFHLNFCNPLVEEEEELIRQRIQSITSQSLGIDPGSTFVQLISSHEPQYQTCLQVSLFMLMSVWQDQNLQQQTLSSIRNLVDQDLQKLGFDFELQDRPLHLDSPIPL